MNPLQEHAHLFVNGKFKVRTRGGFTCDIRGYLTRSNLIKLEYGDTKTNEYPRYLTLIARPIADMTDEEITSMMEVNSPTKTVIRDKIGKLKWLTKRGQIPLTDIVRLSYFGVYFGPQSHFEDGTVIDSRTLKI